MVIQSIHSLSSVFLLFILYFGEYQELIPCHRMVRYSTTRYFTSWRIGTRRADIRVLLRLVDCAIKALLRVQDDVCFQNHESVEWKCLSSRILILHKSVQETVGFHFTICLHTFLLTISYTLPIQLLTCAWD